MAQMFQALANFKAAGKQYNRGELFDEPKDWPNFQAMIDSKMIAPYVVGVSAIPKSGGYKPPIVIDDKSVRDNATLTEKRKREHELQTVAGMTKREIALAEKAKADAKVAADARANAPKNDKGDVISPVVIEDKTANAAKAARARMKADHAKAEAAKPEPKPEAKTSKR